MSQAKESRLYNCLHLVLFAGITKPALLAGGISCLAAFPANWLFIFRLNWGLHGSIAASIVSEAAYLAVLLATALVSSSLAPPEERCACTATWPSVAFRDKRLPQVLSPNRGLSPTVPWQYCAHW